jgi:hypothetical protein
MIAGRFQLGARIRPADRKGSALALLASTLLFPGVAEAQGVTGRLEQLSLVWVAVAVVAIVAIAVAIMLWKRQESAYRPDEADAPPIVFPAAPSGTRRPIRPAPVAPNRPSMFSQAVQHASPESPPPMPAAREPQPPVLAADETTQPRPMQPFGGEAAVATAAAKPQTAPDSLVDGKTIRFHRPMDGTLQILPGRLDIVEGDEAGQTIRFVRTSPEVEISFGRTDGPAYRHIQLRAPTVSRKHALMRMQGTRWSIANLSRTNPVVVNGDELDAEGEARTLREGDRIEMGEIAFVFRER